VKNSALLLVTLLAASPALIATANAGDRSIPRTGTAFEVGRQYADCGPYCGVTSGHTGTALDVARDSMRYLGSFDRIAADWRTPPVLAKGE
jgi:hypothetical protein